MRHINKLRLNQNGIIHHLMLFIVAGFVVVAIGFAGWKVWNNKPLQPEEALKKYLTYYAKTVKYSGKDEYSGSGTTNTNSGNIDIDAKSFQVLSELVCTPQIDGKTATLKLSMQNENGTMYLSLNEASGEITNYQTGQVRQLEEVFSKAKNIWYKLPDNTATESQIESGVFVSESGVLAPGTDSTKLVDALLSKEVFKITSSSHEKQNNILELEVNKSKYLEVLKEVFPNLKNPDLILDDAFGDASSKQITLTVDKEGKLVEEKLSQPNPCTDMVTSFLGEKFSGISKEMSGTSTPKEAGSIKVTPVASSKPFTELFQDLVL